uniref:Uncharacterized protein n=1 Tax=Glossina palpalis gambiensis TaxID=67801 RepID=A0A1B0APK3_9MUSC
MPKPPLLPSKLFSISSELYEPYQVSFTESFTDVTLLTLIPDYRSLLWNILIIMSYVFITNR